MGKSSILAEKTADSFARISIFRDLSRYFTVLGNPRRKNPRFFCEDWMKTAEYRLYDAAGIGTKEIGLEFVNSLKITIFAKKDESCI